MVTENMLYYFIFTYKFHIEKVCSFREVEKRDHSLCAEQLYISSIILPAVDFGATEV